MSDTDPAQAGADAVRAFIDAFNAQDHERLAGTLNYPHVRLANGRFLTVPDAADFAERSRKGKARLEAERWDHTVISSLEVIHQSPDKVHVALTMDRCHADGTVYNRFDTLWIATEQNGHWGIQFRSSYLAGASPTNAGAR